MSDFKEMLSRSTLFSGLGTQDIDRLAPLFDPRDLHVGDVLTSEGEPARYFFLLERGTLLLAYGDGKAVVLNASGDFAGMELVSAKAIYKATATVLGPGRAHAIFREDFLAFVREDTPGASGVMEAWQTVLDSVGDFVRNQENDIVPIRF